MTNITETRLPIPPSRMLLEPHTSDPLPRYGFAHRNSSRQSKNAGSSLGHGAREPEYSRDGYCRCQNTVPHFEKEIKPRYYPSRPGRLDVLDTKPVGRLGDTATIFLFFFSPLGRLAGAFEFMERRRSRWQAAVADEETLTSRKDNNPSEPLHVNAGGPLENFQKTTSPETFVTVD